MQKKRKIYHKTNLLSKNGIAFSTAIESSNQILSKIKTVLHSLLYFIIKTFHQESILLIANGEESKQIILLICMCLKLACNTNCYVIN